MIEVMNELFLFIFFGGFSVVGVFSLLAVFLPGLIVFIYNLRNGKQNHWPIKHIVGTIISGVIMTSGIIAAGIFFSLTAYYIVLYTPTGGSSSSAISTAIQYLLLKINL